MIRNQRVIRKTLEKIVESKKAELAASFDDPSSFTPPLFQLVSRE
jgi:hypothetical protein